jgi:hypothetical protein
MGVLALTLSLTPGRAIADRNLLATDLLSLTRFFNSTGVGVRTLTSTLPTVIFAQLIRAVCWGGRRLTADFNANGSIEFVGGFAWHKKLQWILHSILCTLFAAVP